MADCFISVYFNVGLFNEFGEYDQELEEMKKYIWDFVESGFVNIIGGCCGIIFEYIQFMVEVVVGLFLCQVFLFLEYILFSGLELFIICFEINFVNVGEWINVIGF